jgi:hypothetical protein
MIVFDLKCKRGHIFEAWFKSSEAYEEQLGYGEIECPVCGENHVEKAVMAPNVAKKGNQSKGGTVAFGEARDDVVDYARLPNELKKELDGVLDKIRAHVEETCEYVGDEFAEEARKIHYGEAPERGIYGEASVEDSIELIEEGIDVVPVPGVKKPGRTDA